MPVLTGIPASARRAFNPRVGGSSPSGPTKTRIRTAFPPPAPVFRCYPPTLGMPRRWQPEDKQGDPNSE